MLMHSIKIKLLTVFLARRNMKMESLIDRNKSDAVLQKYLAGKDLSEYREGDSTQTLERNL